MKRMIQNAARSVGIDILSLDYSKDYIYEHHLQAMLARHKIETVLDIGANIGGYGTLLRKIGFSGRILSFEPVTEPFLKLKALAGSDQKWDVFAFAFGEREETKAINVMAGSELCSFLPAAEQSPRMTQTESRDVEVRTLDGFAGVDWTRTFVKIDTQGHDVAVMRGGLRVLKQVPLIQSEVSFLPIYRGMPTFAEAIGFMNSIGFDVTGLFPVSRDQHLRVREFDCMAINRTLL